MSKNENRVKSGKALAECYRGPRDLPVLALKDLRNSASSLQWFCKLMADSGIPGNVSTTTTIANE
jgi:hypothetical protein